MSWYPGPARCRILRNISLALRLQSDGVHLFGVQRICRIRRCRPFQCLVPCSRCRNACRRNSCGQSRSAQGLRNRDLLGGGNRIFRRTSANEPRAEEAPATTGQPLKFVGVGEKFDAFEPFHPDRVANRILGMGDILSFIEKASEEIDQKKAVEMQRKLIDNEFTLEDFRDQLRQIRKLGPLSGLLDMMPKVGMLKELKDVKVDENEINHVVAIIDSMTPRERDNHMIINGSRRRRIARGSGRSVQEVNQLLKQYAQARKMMKSLSGGFLGRKFGKMKMPAGFPFGNLPGR